MLDITLATHNRHKVRELKQLLAVSGIRWRSLIGVPGAPSVPETGRTFDANATLKALAVARFIGGLALADDSGLEVDALDGRPGVESARFAGAHGDDHANNEKLMGLLRGVPRKQRRARYRCSLVLADASGVIRLTRGLWRGYIGEQPLGRGGFGYDPIFVVPTCERTVAQLPAAMKRRLSHRAIAACRLRTTLQRLVAQHRTVTAQAAAHPRSALNTMRV